MKKDRYLKIGILAVLSAAALFGNVDWHYRMIFWLIIILYGILTY